MNTELNSRQISAAQALGRGLTRAQAADAANVHQRTIYKYLNDPTFRQFVEDCRHQHLQGALGAMATGSRSAAVFLHGVVVGEYDSQDPKILNSRIRAATSLLNSSINLTKYEEMKAMRRAYLGRDEAQELVETVKRIVEYNIDDDETFAAISDGLRDAERRVRWYG